MSNSKDAHVSTNEILFPVCLITFVVMAFLAFQTSLIMKDRDGLHDAIAQQNKPLEEANKVQTQFSALAMGTRKLAQSGDKEAAALVDRLKKAGIYFGDENQQAAPQGGTMMAPQQGTAPSAPKP